MDNQQGNYTEAGTNIDEVRRQNAQSSMSSNMNLNVNQPIGNFTVAGTDIDEVKRRNAQSGMSYNEMKQLVADNVVQNTASFSTTDVEQVKKDIRENRNTH